MKSQTKKFQSSGFRILLYVVISQLLLFPARKHELE